MEHNTDPFVQAFFKTLENGIAELPLEERERLYRPCAESCANGYVLGEMKRQFEECGCDLDAQFTKYGRSEYFFADIIQPGSVYELGYPRCLCPAATEAGISDSPVHCECSRQSIIYVLENLLPGRDIRVETMYTVLGGADECRFRVTVL